MATLAQRLPYTHPFAGGFPYRGSQRLPSDPDALTYLAAVAAADGAPVETAVATAVDDFFRGTKADGTFSALKAASLLCGARTLAGALVPLVGAAPTNNNFVDADYNRGTGLKGNGSTKYLDSNRAHSADAQDDRHISVFAASKSSVNSELAGSLYGSGAGWTRFVNSGHINPNAFSFGLAASYAAPILLTTSGNADFVGASRSSSSSITVALGSTLQTASQASQAPNAGNYQVFRAGGNVADNRLSWYSIGESVDLALLDARVTALVQRIQLSLSTGLDASGYDDATVAYLLAAYNNGATLE